MIYSPNDSARKASEKTRAAVGSRRSNKKTVMGINRAGQNKNNKDAMKQKIVQ